MTPDFENKFREWFDLVAGEDPQHYQDLEWEWEDEIYKFLDNPDEYLSEQKKIKKEDDEYAQNEIKEMEKLEK